MANASADSDPGASAQRNAAGPCPTRHGSAVAAVASNGGVLIVSDIRFLREMLADVLAQDHAFNIVGIASSAEAALDIMAGRGEPEIVLIDASLPGGRAAAPRLLQCAPSARLVAFAVAETEDEIIAWAEAGVAAYLPRTTALTEIADRISEIRNGEQPCTARIAAGLLRRIAAAPRAAPTAEATTSGALTSREREVMHLIVAGNSNKEIARQLDIGLATVKSHVHNLLGKLELRRRSQLALWSRQHNPAMPPRMGASPSWPPPKPPSFPTPAR